jgi:hypothetical protein
MKVDEVTRENHGSPARCHPAGMIVLPTSLSLSVILLVTLRSREDVL